MKVEIEDKTATLNQLKKFGKIILLIILALLCVIIGVKIYRALMKPANANYIQGGGKLPEDWNPAQITDTLYDAIKGIFTWTNTKDEAYAKFNALNDNQMIAVYNDWNNRYSQKSSFGSKMGTLTEAVKDESNYSVFGGVNNMDLMISNLDRLKLK